MLEIVIYNELGTVDFAISQVAVVRHITPSEVGYTDVNGRKSSFSLLRSETIEVRHA